MLAQLIFLAAALTSLEAPPADLFDQAILDDDWFFIPIGDADISFEGNKHDGSISEYERKNLYCLEKAGLVKILRDSTPSASIDDPVLHGHIRTALTPLGIETDKNFVETPAIRKAIDKRGEIKVLRLQITEEHALNILSDQSMEVRGTHFRIIAANASAKTTDTAAPFVKACAWDEPPPIAHKRILVQWLVEDKRWEWRRSDTANATGKYKTDYIGRYLKAFRP